MNEKSAEQQVAEGEMVTGNFTLQAQLPQGKTITMSGYIYAHNDVHSISNQVDALHDVMDRQRVRAEIPELEAKLDQRVAQLENMRDAMTGLETKQKSGKKLTTAESKMLEDMALNIERVKDDITKGQKAIHEAKKAVGRE